MIEINPFHYLIEGRQRYSVGALSLMRRVRFVRSDLAEVELVGPEGTSVIEYQLREAGLYCIADSGSPLNGQSKRYYPEPGLLEIPSRICAGLRLQRGGLEDGVLEVIAVAPTPQGLRFETRIAEVGEMKVEKVWLESVGLVEQRYLQRDLRAPLLELTLLKPAKNLPTAFEAGEADA